jgi:hypothetical protein
LAKRARSRQELANRVRTVLEHLLRLDASPANNPRAGWRTTIVRSRAEIEILLEDPRLELTTVIADELPVARRLAALNLKDHGETPRRPLDQISYTEQQVMDPDFWPD